TGRSIGLFIDGIEISTYGSSFNLNNIPPALIDRIEVYKGVLPSHLSGDLLGGAINIVLKKGAAANNLSAAISYGSFNTLQADFSGQYRNPKNRSEEHTSELQSRENLVCRLLLEKKKN